MKRAIRSGCRVLVAVLAAGAVAVSARESGPRSISIHVDYRHVDWVVGQPALDDPEAAEPTTTYNVLASRYVALDPTTHEPTTETPAGLECDPKQVVSRFALEKRAFLLGEPILVDYRLSLDGPGTWSWTLMPMMDNSGRQAGFAVLMRGEDGAWLTDYFPQPNICVGGGLFGGPEAVKKRAPKGTTLAVQRWCAISKPGVYDLYCVRFGLRSVVAGEDTARTAALPDDVRAEGLVFRGDLVDASTGVRPENVTLNLDGAWSDPTTPSPIVGMVPAELAAQLGDRLSSCSAFARFRIVVREGTPEERRTMVDSWVARAEDGPADAPFGSASRAVRDAMWTTRQDDFLPAIAKLAPGIRDGDAYLLDGLALRRDTKATAILLSAPRSSTLRAMWRLSSAQIPAVIPTLVDWLADPDVEVRGWAENFLIQWSGTSSDHRANGESGPPPTLEQGQALQPIWRAWWERARASGSFVPDRSQWISFPDE